MADDESFPEMNPPKEGHSDFPLQQLTGDQRIWIDERRQTAIKLRREGATYEQIAKTIREHEKFRERFPGYNKQAAYNDVRVLLAEVQLEAKETTEEYVELELQRLDALHAKFWKQAITGDFTSAAMVMRLMEKRAFYRGYGRVDAKGNPAAGGLTLNVNNQTGVLVGSGQGMYGKMSDAEIAEEFFRLQRVHEQYQAVRPPEQLQEPATLTVEAPRVEQAREDAGLPD